MFACKNRVGHKALMGELGFEEHFSSLMDGGFALHSWGEKGRCRQQQQTQGVPGGLKTEENGGQIHREGRTSHVPPVPPLFPLLINIWGEEQVIIKEYLIDILTIPLFFFLF